MATPPKASQGEAAEARRSQVQVPDALVAYILRRAGCDVGNDPRCLRVAGRHAANFARRLFAGTLPGEASGQLTAADAAAAATTNGEATKPEEAQGYWVEGMFIATNAASVTHVLDGRGENWVVRFERPIISHTGKRSSSIWYSCVKHGHENALALARRHLPRVTPPVGGGSRRKRGRGGGAEEQVQAGDGCAGAKEGGEAEGAVEKPPPPIKVIRLTPILEALGAPQHVHDALIPGPRRP